MDISVKEKEKQLLKEEQDWKDLAFLLVEKLKKEESQLPMISKESIYEIKNMIIGSRIEFKNGVNIYLLKEHKIQIELRQIYIAGEVKQGTINKEYYIDHLFTKKDLEDMHITIMRYLNTKRMLKNKYKHAFSDLKTNLNEYKIKFRELYNEDLEICEGVAIEELIRIVYNEKNNNFYVKFILNFAAHESGYLVKSILKMFNKINIVKTVG